MNRETEIRASIAMAVCNGEKYIKEQIDSILNLMRQTDEIVISYNESVDSTLRIITDYENMDNRIHVFVDDGNTVESNFNNAVKNCRGKYIFLSDQDDVWINEKIDKMVYFFECHPDCVVLIGDGYMTDKELTIKDQIFRCLKTTRNPMRNFIKGSYLGCQMAFRERIKSTVWPVSTSPPLAHDLWLGVYGAFWGKVYLLNEPTILHRLHEDNYTNNSKMSMGGVIRDRINFFSQIIKRYVKHLMLRFGA